MQTATASLVESPNISTVNFKKNSCKDFNNNNICFTRSLDDEDVDAFNSIVKHSKKYNRGDYLYKAGDRFDSFYIIRSGSLKTFINDEEGREQIIGFYIQGDVVALDGATSTVYPTSAQALETSYLCEISFAGYMQLASSIPSLYQALLSQMSNQILNEEKHLLMIGTKSAEQRLATLLLNFSNRYTNRGFSKTAFNLHMSRRDIGNYLSAAMETVSRLFSRLQSMGLIEVHGKLIEIKDLDGLQKYAA